MSVLVGCWFEWAIGEVVGCGVQPAFVGGSGFLFGVVSALGEGNASSSFLIPVRVQYHCLWPVFVREVRWEGE